MRAGSEESQRSPGALVVIVVFAALLLAPAVLALTGHAGFDTAFIEHTELRHPFVAPKPSVGALATGGWERDAEREIADAFPLRRALIESYEDAKYSWLRDVASTHVIAGRDGWFFLGDEERQYLTGTFHPSDAALAQLADLYQARAGWCAQHGMTYVFLLVPNKSTVYANELPAGLRFATPTPADRLLPLLRARGVRTIDVRGALTEAAAHGEVYSKGDTHWNDAGAYLAYRATVAALRDAGAPVRDTILPRTISSHVEPGDGDLLKLAGIATLVQNHIVRYDFPHRAHALDAPAYRNDPDAAAFIAAANATDDRTLPSAVVFGDSFTDALRPFLAESFRRAVFLRHVNVTDVQFDRRILAAENPAVVVQELAERSLVFGADFKP